MDDLVRQPTTIDYERVLSSINAERRAAGLPQIEHAVMRVRVNIRLAIHGIERLSADSQITLSQKGLQELALALNELFQTSFTAASLAGFSPKVVPVEVSSDSVPPISSRSVQDVTHATFDSRIYLVDLYSAINQARRMRVLPPIEPAVIAVRLGVRFAILARRKLDFHQAYLPLAEAELGLFRQILIDQFDVDWPEGLSALLASGRKRAEEQPKKLGWIERLFRKRTHEISVPALIMAVTRQRANLGYRPLSPTVISTGCRENLIALGIKIKPEEQVLKLNEQQLDALAAYLRDQYGLFFEDLIDFIGSNK
ncbi:hypothetical protein [Halothiobacillus sp. DCM-1]|uniref:hypothetical protein n=1 Tax=Halothiobacillus sp. DCM-1 TaxID=3112558 RepID=UPI0032533245